MESDLDFVPVLESLRKSKHVRFKDALEESLKRTLHDEEEVQTQKARVRICSEFCLFFKTFKPNKETP